MKAIIIVLIVIAGSLHPGPVPRDGNSDQDTVKIAGIVLKWTPKNRERNYSRFEKLVREAARRKAKIVCSSECFLDGYAARDGKITSHEFRSYALKAPEDKYYIGLNKLADELDIYIIAGVSELDGGRVYNSAIVFGPDGKVVGTYKKNVLWGFENDKFTAGNGFPTFKTRYGNIGIMICFERQKPKIAKELKKNGAQVIFCLSGGGFGDMSDRIMMQRSRESGLPIVFVHPAEFLVTGPDGKILSRYLFGNQLDDNKKGTLGGITRICTLTLIK